MTLGTRIKDRRTRMGWTLQELANASGLSKTFVWELEQDQGRPGVDAALAISRALGCTIDDLVVGRDENPKSMTAAEIAACRLELIWQLKAAAETIHKLLYEKIDNRKDMFLIESSIIHTIDELNYLHAGKKKPRPSP